MASRFFLNIKSIFASFRLAFYQLKSRSSYEIVKVFICPKTHKHKLEVKITGKLQSISCFAEEIATDDRFISGFSVHDVRTIVYYATADRFEAILEEKKIKKIYEIMRSKNIKGMKAAKVRNKLTNEYLVMPLNDFVTHDIIDKLDSWDAYQIGYLLGQEQIWKDSVRLKMITNKDAMDCPNE